jgi:hypothetical protein
MRRLVPQITRVAAGGFSDERSSTRCPTIDISVTSFEFFVGS